MGSEMCIRDRTYTDQAFKVLDKDKTEIVYNGDWFRKMTFEDVLRLNSRVTMQQMLQREDFRNRIDSGQEVRLHEIQYPIVQGWDSVEVRADVEIGGSDQLFNILVGRDLQKEEGQLPQIVLTMPLLEGLDGVKKMSKSYGNYVGVSEEPNTMFQKLMSTSDDLMDRYYQLLLGQERDTTLDPREAKKQLAHKLVTRYHSEAEADEARKVSEARSKGDDSAGAISFEPFKDGSNLAQQVQEALLQTSGEEKSLGAIKKQYILPGAVQLNGVKLTDPAMIPELKAGDILRLSKKRSVKIA